MDPTQFTWLALFGVAAYFIITDGSVSEFFYIFFLGVWVQLRKYYYMVTLHPFWIMNPIGRWWMMRKYRKMSEEILKSIKEQEESEGASP